MQLQILAWTPSGVSAVPLRRRGGTIRAYTWADEADEALSNRRRWSLSRHSYAVAEEGPRHDRKHIKLHRLLMGLEHGDGREVDHIDGNRLNNRRSNLRSVTARQNRQNQRPRRNVSSRFRGVSYDRSSRRWRATMTVTKDGSRLQLSGLYRSEIEAAEQAAAWRRLHMTHTND